MTLNYQQLHEQVQRLGENALSQEERLKKLRQLASKLLESYTWEIDFLQQRVHLVVEHYDKHLRCALPTGEPLNSHFPPPQPPTSAFIMAADGSQINPDRHAALDFCLVNVGAIQMSYGHPAPPETTIQSYLIYGDELYTSTGTLSEDQVALMRNLNELRLIAKLVTGIEAQPGTPILAFSDGPLEFWGAKAIEGGAEYRQGLKAYKEVLTQLHRAEVTIAGYVDKPAADLVIRLLEVASLPVEELPDVRSKRPLRGVTDAYLYSHLLTPGERSAIFALRSKSTADYPGQLALHFFYLNVGEPEHPWIARVEIPAWVSTDSLAIDDLQAILLDQCRMLGHRRYPYLLHRAHELAVVSLEEHNQVEQMIVSELIKHGLTVGEKSHKQAVKDLAKRTRYAL